MNPAPEPQQNGRVRAPAHLGARFFHLLFKTAALLYYVLCNVLFQVDNFVTNFIVLLLLLSADFWVVKNVTGRLLVGLRWWNDVTEEGEGWRYETLEEGQRRINATDTAVFWAGLVGNVALWIVFTILTMLKPSIWEYLLICVIALIMGGSNTYGYFKCSKEARNAVRQYAQDALTTAATSSAAVAVAGSVAQSRVQGK